MAINSGQKSFTYEFEKPVEDLDARISDLHDRIHQGEDEVREELAELEAERDRLLSQIVADLTPYQRVKLARHPRRPQSRDYIKLLFDEFIELHGDRRFGDDRAIITGFAKLEERRLMLVAQQKGQSTREKMETNFGMPQPEGYRKALLRMEQAEKFNLPVVTLIDTPGAAPAVEAEERGQGMAIAENIYRMAGLETPIITIITGEGCSGGALGIGIGDRHAMLENAYYSVISPEGCAAILFHDSEKAEQAASSLRLTAEDMLNWNVIDEIIEEPPGGAHRDPVQAAEHIKSFLSRTLDALGEISVDRLLRKRYERYRELGTFAVENT